MIRALRSTALGNIFWTTLQMTKANRGVDFFLHIVAAIPE